MAQFFRTVEYSEHFLFMKLSLIAESSVCFSASDTFFQTNTSRYAAPG